VRNLLDRFRFVKGCGGFGKPPSSKRGAPTKKLYTPRGDRIQKDKGGVFHNQVSQFYFYIELGEGVSNVQNTQYRGGRVPSMPFGGMGYGGGLKSDLRCGGGSYLLNLCYDSVVDAITHGIT